MAVHVNHTYHPCMSNPHTIRGVNELISKVSCDTKGVSRYALCTIPPQDLISVAHRRINMLQITAALLLSLEVDVPGSDHSRQSPVVPSDKSTEPSIGSLHLLSLPRKAPMMDPNMS
jgi:hypothetical protein